MSGFDHGASTPASSRFWHGQYRAVLALCAIFTAMLAGSLYFLGKPAGDHAATNAREITFSIPQGGQLLIRSPSGDRCRQMHIDNRSGALLQGGMVECVDENALANSGKAFRSNRIDEIRNSFKR